MVNDNRKLSLFYDGSCPLCRAEIQFLAGRNQAQLLEFIDINSAAYNPTVVGVSCEQALAAMYGQFSNGTVINGVAVFSAAYSRANLPWLAWVFSRKILQPPLALGYRFFAKNRHAIAAIFGPSALWLVNTFAAKNSS